MVKPRYNYRIYQSVYDAIVSGKKNIEIRLLNKKSKKIKKGDEILFSVLNSDKTLLVEVTNIYFFDNIEELWKNKDVILSSAINSTKDEFVNTLNKIFGEETVDVSKLIGIEFIIK